MQCLILILLHFPYFRGIYNLEHPNFKDISKAALDCIERLLETDGQRRLTATECLEHNWLTGSYLDTLKQLETTWMRKYLAKRRWQRWFNTVKAMNRMQRLVQEHDGQAVGIVDEAAAHHEEMGGLSKLMAKTSINNGAGAANKERWV